MSVTIRPYVNGGWEVDIRILLPDGTDIRDRRKAPVTSMSAAQKWGEARERVLLVNGKPRPVPKEVQQTPILQEFATRFLDGYAKANRLKPSGIAAIPRLQRLHRRRIVAGRRRNEALLLQMLEEEPQCRRGPAMYAVARRASPQEGGGRVPCETGRREAAAFEPTPECRDRPESIADGGSRIAERRQHRSERVELRAERRCPHALHGGIVP
jgi:hypothetical protein